jgi:hypothetical protein
MAKFKLQDLAVIEPGNPAWQSVEAWANFELGRMREIREDKKLEQRELDLALGDIIRLKELLRLPKLIKQERNRTPVTGDDFGIPNLNTDNT